MLQIAVYHINMRNSLRIDGPESTEYRDGGRMILKYGVRTLTSLKFTVLIMVAR